MIQQRGGFLMGLIVGLLAGLAIALGVALYIAKVPVPFVNKVPQRTADQDAAETVKNRDWNPNAALGGKSTARAAAQAASGVVQAASAAAAASTALLSSAARASGSDALAARPVREAASAAPGGTSVTQTAASARSSAAVADAFSYQVQAGAYSRPDDAEQQRARLAMLGFTAKVLEREQSGRTVYRVRLGPFEVRDEADGVISRLQAAGIDSALVRVER